MTKNDIAIIAAIRRDYSTDIILAHGWESLPAADWPDDRAREIVKTADAIALYFEALLWQPNALDWAPEIHVFGGGWTGSIAERFMPLIAQRPRECWRTEVERLLGKRSA